MSSFAIQAVHPDGEVMYVRQGPLPGEGAVTQFPSRQAAKTQMDFFKMGMEEGEDYESMSIIPYSHVPKEERNG